MTKLPVFHRKHAVDILHMFNDIFEDIDSAERMDADKSLCDYDESETLVGSNLSAVFSADHDESDSDEESEACCDSEEEQ